MRALTLTVVSALLYAAAFPPLSLGWLAWVALAPLFAALANSTLIGGVVLGTLWAGIATIGVGWCFPHMVASYFGAPSIVGWAALLLLAFVLAGGFFAAFGAWLAWMTSRGGTSPLLVAAAWGACELARGRALVGWALAGYSQVDAAPLIQLAEIAGPYGVGILIAGVNAGLAGLFVPCLRGRFPWTERAAVVAALAAALAFGHARLGDEVGTGEPVRVAALQGAVGGPAPAGAALGEAKLARYLELTARAAARGPAIVVWPENAVEFPLVAGLPAARRLRDATRDLEPDLLLGAPSVEIDDQRAVYRNSVYLLRRGVPRGRYDKLRLVPLAEAPLPLLRGGFAGRLAPGGAPRAIETRAGLAAVFLCYEAMYPEVVRRVASAPGVALLINPASDAWFGFEPPARHYLDITRVRAIENRRALVRAASTGYSAVVDPFGRVLARGTMSSPGVVEASLRVAHVPTFYRTWGDLVAWTAVLATALATAARLRPVARAGADQATALPGGW